MIMLEKKKKTDLENISPRSSFFRLETEAKMGLWPCPTFCISLSLTLLHSWLDYLGGVYLMSQEIKDPKI